MNVQALLVQTRTALCQQFAAHNSGSSILDHFLVRQASRAITAIARVPCTRICVSAGRSSLARAIAVMRQQLDHKDKPRRRMSAVEMVKSVGEDPVVQHS